MYIFNHKEITQDLFQVKVNLNRRSSFADVSHYICYICKSTLQCRQKNVQKIQFCTCFAHENTSQKQDTSVELQTFSVLPKLKFNCLSLDFKELFQISGTTTRLCCPRGHERSTKIPNPPRRQIDRPIALSSHLFQPARFASL